MSKFFDLFPRIDYNVQGTKFGNLQRCTNIMFRVRFLKVLLGNISAYYEHTIQDGDTPEILADKFYGDPEAHWIILLANDIVDPHYDWPLNYKDFNKYIINKYGSIETAKITYHHYEKVIQRERSDGTVAEFRYNINQSALAVDDPSVPYDSYDSLTATQAVSTYNLEDGTTVVETIFRDRISNYDWELDQNEKKRIIKVIKKEYYPLVMDEFNKLTEYRNTPYRRKLKY